MQFGIIGILKIVRLTFYCFNLEDYTTTGTWTLLFDINFNLITPAFPANNGLVRKTDNKADLWSIFYFKV